MPRLFYYAGAVASIYRVLDDFVIGLKREISFDNLIGHAWVRAIARCEVCLV